LGGGRRLRHFSLAGTEGGEKKRNNTALLNYGTRKSRRKKEYLILEKGNLVSCVLLSKNLVGRRGGREKLVDIITKLKLHNNKRRKKEGLSNHYVLWAPEKKRQSGKSPS